jgi:hypothetical protein
MLKKEAKEITGGLSAPGKMPEGSYNLPAVACQTGAKLRLVPDTPCYKCYAFKGGDCPASKQGNQCGSCRRCWNPKVKHVTYPKH